MSSSGNLATGQAVNFSNGLSRLYSAHGATSFQREDEREADVRDRPWRIESFEGTLGVFLTGSSPKGVDDAFGISCRMGASVAIPREEGSGVPSRILLPEASIVRTEYFAYAGQSATIPLQRAYQRLRIGRTLYPSQDWLINFEVDHTEGTMEAKDVQVLVYGRFRCSRP